MPARLPCQGGVEEPCTCPQWTFDLLAHLGSHPHDDCHDELYATTLTPTLTTRYYKVSEMHPLSKTQLRNVVAVASGYPDGRSHGLNLNGNSMVDDTSMDDTSMVDDNSITTPAQCRLPMGPPPVKEEAPPMAFASAINRPPQPQSMGGANGLSKVVPGGRKDVASQLQSMRANGGRKLKCTFSNGVKSRYECTSESCKWSVTLRKVPRTKLWDVSSHSSPHNHAPSASASGIWRR